MTTKFYFQREKWQTKKDIVTSPSGTIVMQDRSFTEFLPNFRISGKKLEFSESFRLSSFVGKLVKRNSAPVSAHALSEG